MNKKTILTLIKKVGLFSNILIIFLIQNIDLSKVYANSLIKECMEFHFISPHFVREEHVQELFTKIDQFGDWTMRITQFESVNTGRFRKMKNLLLSTQSTQAESVRAFDYFLEKMKIYTHGNWGAKKTFNPESGSFIYTGNKGPRLMIDKKSKIFIEVDEDIHGNSLHLMPKKWIELKKQ